jgi:hypothetical protein
MKALASLERGWYLSRKAFSAWGSVVGAAVKAEVSGPCTSAGRIVTVGGAEVAAGGAEVAAGGAEVTGTATARQEKARAAMSAFYG